MLVNNNVGYLDDHYEVFEEFPVTGTYSCQFYSGTAKDFHILKDLLDISSMA